ncbi:MAG: PoNe immunity protein domain-containing protein [Methylococcaceae bacterium]|jgi:hypothetical protein
MTNSFNEKRRQQFITEKFGKNQIERRNRMEIALQEEMVLDETDDEGLSLLTASCADNGYERLSIRYTAGIPIEELRSELTGVIEALERYQKALADYEQAPIISPLGLGQLDDYERAMQILGLCVLLHRPDLLKRIAKLIDPGYKGEDTLYEDILAYYEPNRVELDEWYHEQPYTPLIHAMYEEDGEKSAKKLNEYCKNWYPAFKYVPWHDGHLRINGDEGDYFGYWAFEAGAVAYLCDIDDSDINHMVYPKDLVAWARENKALSETGDEGNAKLRCAANQPCPQSGIWHTPANKDSRRAFKAGDLMPDFPSSDYGLTIWYLDESQEHWDLPS